MKKIWLSLLLLFSLSHGIDTLTVPTDFNTVTSGTRANLSTNFTSIQTWGNKVRDSLAQVTARLTGYSGTILVSSLSNLRLKLDADNSETARLLVESGSGDSLFTVSEDTTAKFYGPLTLNKTLGVIGVATFTAAPVISSATVSTDAAFDASKNLVSVAITGTGVGVRATSPTLVTPAIGAATATSIVASDTITAVNFKTTKSTITVSGEDVIFKSLGTAPAFIIFRNSVGTDKFTFKGDGAMTAGTLALNGNEPFDYDEGTFTAKITGCTTLDSATGSFVRVGKAVIVKLPAITAVSNTTALTFTGLSASIRPTTAVFTNMISAVATDNGAVVTAAGTRVLTDGSVTFYLNGSATGWTAANAKGLASSVSLSYTMQ